METTFVNMFRDVCRLTPDKEAVVSYDENMSRKALTFNELWTLSSRYAHILKKAGVQRHDHVVVTTPLSIEYHVASFGVILAGAVHLSMERLVAGAHVITETVNLSRAKFLILSGDEGSDVWSIFSDNARKAPGNTNVATVTMKHMPSLTTLLFTNRDSDKVGFLDLLRNARQEYQDEELEPGDPAFVGTTFCAENVANLKLCELSHGALTYQAQTKLKSLPHMHKELFCYPWYIAAGFPFDNLVGFTRILPDLWKPLQAELYGLSMKIKKAEGLGRMCSTVSEMNYVVEKRKGLTSKYVDVASIGGQPVTTATFQKIKEFCNTLHIVYFSTEALFVCVNEVDTSGSYTAFDAGLPFDGVNIRIIDDNLEVVPPGVSGRIAIQSPALFTRYLGEPAKTTSVLTKDGWFLSDDAGYLSAEGRLFVFGRRGDIISRGIVLIYPTWIEKPISAHPEVLEVMAVPVPDDAYTQSVCVCLVKKPDSDLSEDDVKEYQKSAMSEDASGWFPVDHVLFFQDHLPKVSRAKLGELAAEKLGLK